MPSTRRLAGWMTALVFALAACAPQPAAVVPADSSPAAADVAGSARYEALVDPVSRTVTVNPVGMRTQASGVWVRSANANWTAPVFSFDLLVTNKTPSTMTDVRGVVLSTTPGAPTVTATGTNGNLGTGQPYYDYGSIANDGTGTVNWKFSIPSATPFRFGFTIQHGAGGTDAAPGKNHAPATPTVTAASPTIMVNGTTTLSVSTSDPNSDTLSYTWSAPSGGSILGSGATATYTAPAAAGTYPVNVLVDDGKGGTITGTTTISVTAGPGDGTAQGNVSFGPTPAAAVKRVTLSPAAVTIDPGEPVTITATGLDNPGNPVATTWTWSQVGTTASIWRGTFDHGTTGNTASWRTFNGRTDAGAVTVTARSANNQTASMAITVREKAPEILATSPANTVTVKGGVATPFSWTFRDPNGNLSVGPIISVTSGYAYSIPGFPVATDSVAGTMSGNMNVTFNTYGTAQLKVTVGDSAGFSVTQTWNVTIIP